MYMKVSNEGGFFYKKKAKSTFSEMLQINVKSASFEISFIKKI